MAQQDMNGDNITHWNITTEAPPACNIATLGGTCLLFRNIYYLGLIGTISVLGLAGNSLSIGILQTTIGTTVATVLLQGLAIADNNLLLSSLFVLSLGYGLGYSDTYVNYIVKYMQPIAYMAETATIWTTVLLALNRYVAICVPFRAATFSTIKTAKIQVIIVFAFAVVFNIVRFFQIEVHTYITNGTTTTCMASNPSIGEPTLFGVIYTNALYTLLCVIIPLVMLIILNTRLFTEIKRIQHRRTLMTSRAHKASHEEDNITVVMVTIVVFLLVCHLPDRLLQIVKIAIGHEYICGDLIYYSTALTNLLVILNSSTNFIVYYILRSSFRATLRRNIC